MTNGQTISQAARRTGFTPATLRYYEELYLVRPTRSPAGHRRYSETEVELLAFIGRAKRLGLSLRQIRPLAESRRSDDCRSTRAALAESLRQRLAEVRRLSAELDAFADLLESADRRLSDVPASTRCGPGCGCDLAVASVHPAPGRLTLPKPRA